MGHHAWYLRVTLLLVVLLVAYYYAAAIERRLARRYPGNPRATIFVAHAALVLIGFFVFLVNPFSLLLLIPAAMLWPLARPGRWVRSCYLFGWALSPSRWRGVLRAATAPGSAVWWYFFVLFENRTIPVSAALLGAAFLAATGMLASTLHRATLAAPVVQTGEAPIPSRSAAGDCRLADATASPTKRGAGRLRRPAPGAPAGR